MLVLPPICLDNWCLISIWYLPPPNYGSKTTQTILLRLKSQQLMVQKQNTGNSGGQGEAQPGVELLTSWQMWGR